MLKQCDSVGTSQTANVYQILLWLTGEQDEDGMLVADCQQAYLVSDLLLPNLLPNYKLERDKCYYGALKKSLLWGWV
jgi:hypothetical protein